MFESDLTYLGYELDYRAERLRGKRPDRFHEGHHVPRTARRRAGRILSRRAA